MRKSYVMWLAKKDGLQKNLEVRVKKLSAFTIVRETRRGSSRPARDPGFRCTGCRRTFSFKGWLTHLAKTNKNCKGPRPRRKHLAIRRSCRLLSVLRPMERRVVKKKQCRICNGH